MGWCEAFWADHRTCTGRVKRGFLASTHVVLVHHASQPGIQDEALIGGGDINTIRFSDGLVEIECAFPLLIRIPVTALEIEVRAV